MIAYKKIYIFYFSGTGNSKQVANYKAKHLLVRKNFVGKVITLTSLTYYKFWGRYKSIPDYKWRKLDARKM